MYLKKIIAHNIQGIKDYTFEFPSTGLIVFTGPNSNGKSIIVRATRNMLCGDLHKPRRRASLVNRNAQFGELTYVRDDGTELLMHVAREASLTYLCLTEANGEKIMRYLADKSYRELPIRFGWHFLSKFSVSLNIAEQEDALLFYKTPLKENAALVEEAATDAGASTALENIDKTVADAKYYISAYHNQINANSIALSQLRFEPLEPLLAKLEKLQELRRQLVDIHYPTIPDIRPVPNVRFYNLHVPIIPDIKPVPNVRYCGLYVPNIPKLKYPRIIKYSYNIPDITPIARDIVDLENRRCPMCGRRFGCAC